jgi:hypothetical protein
MKREPDQIDAFRIPQPPREAVRPAPYQPHSPTSRDAGELIAPVFKGNRKACFMAIAHANGSGGVTRKQIADRYFDGKQNYVTGPIAVLIEENLVYQEPLRDAHGAIVTRDGEIVPRRIEGSAVLLLTPKGKAVAA